MHELVPPPRLFYFLGIFKEWDAPYINPLIETLNQGINVLWSPGYAACMDK